MDNRITSKDIQKVLVYLETHGNSIREISSAWSKMKIVIIMEKMLNEEQRKYIKQNYNHLTYRFWKGSGWEPGSEDFIDLKERENILLPISEPNPW